MSHTTSSWGGSIDQCATAWLVTAFWCWLGNLLTWHVNCFEFIDHIFTSSNYLDTVDHCIGQIADEPAESSNCIHSSVLCRRTICIAYVVLVQSATGQKYKKN
jgi:hypothetical protein